MNNLKLIEYTDSFTFLNVYEEYYFYKSVHLLSENQKVNLFIFVQNKYDFNSSINESLQNSQSMGHYMLSLCFGCNLSF